MTVVLNAGGGGVLFHEACGHGLEADTIAKDTTVYAHTKGQRVGSEIFHGVDDASDPNGWGSFSFDDEGTPAQRTVLFEGGVQTGEMSDRINAARLGVAPSGNGRRQSYAHLPIPRMTNSYVLPGDSDPALILADVSYGLYADGLGGGEVNPATGDFVFGITEAYLIENGRLTQRVRGANLIGNGPQAIALVDAVGSDFAVKQGMCGKDGQWVPAGFGTPTLRIARLTVGGTGA
jgi:TldD protein